MFFFSSRRRHTRYIGDWSSDVCSSDLGFVIPSPGGGPLVDAEVSPDDLNQARTRWRDLVRGAALGVVALTLLLCAGRLLDLRRGTNDVRSYTVDTLTVLVTIGLTRLVVGFA